MRVRLRYMMLWAATIVAGLAVHWYGGALGERTQDWTGDALWAFMIAAGVSAIEPTLTRGARGGVALGICVAVECSQLAHAPLLDQVRATTLGHLVLGSGFDVRDLGAYLCGVMVFVLIDGWYVKPYARR